MESKKEDMKVKHTPGPWIIRYRNDGKVALINRGTVAEVDLDDNPNGEDNAKLIAAAPDLLEACMNLENDNSAIPEHAWNLIQQAIKKATNGINKD